MTAPDVLFLRQILGLAPNEDFPWLHQIGFYSSKSRPGHYYLRLGDLNKSVSIKFLRSLLHLSRLDRIIDQRKKP